MHVQLTLPAWIVGDGALPAPSVGERVSYRVVFSPANTHDLPEMCIRERATAHTPTRDTDGRYRTRLTFPGFTAAMSSIEPTDGDAAVWGRPFVDYELAVEPGGRLSGTVVDRKLLIEKAHLPSNPTMLTAGYPIAYELHDIEEGPFRFGLSPTPTLGAVLRTQAGLLLTVEVAQS